MNTLVVYGTLRPGESNHILLAHIPGKWEKVTIIGRRTTVQYEDNVYPAILLDGEMEEIPAYAFSSHKLQENFEMLDAFEGPKYIRTTIPYTTQNGKSFSGMIYLKA